MYILAKFSVDDVVANRIAHVIEKVCVDKDEIVNNPEEYEKRGQVGKQIQKKHSDENLHCGHVLRATLRAALSSGL